MTITTETRASEVRDGKCTDCGQFVSRNDIHFHSPKRKFRGAPRAHIFNDGGGMVTRCDDAERARFLLIRKYCKDVLQIPYLDLDDADRADAEAQFPSGRGEVQRGRVNVVAPEADEVAWWWVRLDDHAKGPGVTTAVVWLP